MISRLLTVSFLIGFVKLETIDSDIIDFLNAGDQYSSHQATPYGRAVTKGVLIDEGLEAVIDEGLFTEDTIDNIEDLREAIDNLDYPDNIGSLYANHYYGPSSTDDILGSPYSILDSVIYPFSSHPLRNPFPESQEKVFDVLLESIQQLEHNHFTNLLQNHQNGLFSHKQYLHPLSVSPVIASPYLQLNNHANNYVKSGSIRANGLPGRKSNTALSGGIGHGPFGSGGQRIFADQGHLGELGSKRQRVSGSKTQRLISSTGHGLLGGKRQGAPENLSQTQFRTNGRKNVHYGAHHQNSYLDQRRAQENSGNPWNYRNKGAADDTHLYSSFEANKLNRKYDTNYGPPKLSRPHFVLKSEHSKLGKNVSRRPFHDSDDNDKNHNENDQEVGVFFRKDAYEGEDVSSRSNRTTQSQDKGIEEQEEETSDATQESVTDVEESSDDEEKSESSEEE